MDWTMDVSGFDRLEAAEYPRNSEHVVGTSRNRRDFSWNFDMVLHMSHVPPPCEHVCQGLHLGLASRPSQEVMDKKGPALESARTSNVDGPNSLNLGGPS